MIKNRLILFLTLIVIVCKVDAKNVVIEFDAKYNVIGTTSIEPNEMVLLSGAYNSEKVIDFQVYTIIRGITTEITVNFSDDKWTAQIGPFLPNETVMLKFSVKDKLSSKDIVQLKTQFETAFQTSIDWIKNNYIPARKILYEDSLFSVFSDHFKQALPITFNQYKNQDDVTASQLILQSLKNNQKSNFYSFYSNINDIKKAKSNIEVNKQVVIDSLPNTTASSFFTDSLTFLYDSAKFIENFQTSINAQQNLSNVVVFDLDEIRINANKIISKENENQEFLDGFLKEAALLNVCELTTSLENNTTLTIDIHQYMGFDITPVIFTGDNRPDNAFGTLFTISPYFGKINPNDKIIQYKPLKEEPHQKRARKWGNFKRCVTPTVGLALYNPSDSTHIKPVIYTGIGIRINPLVRFTAGASMYVPVKNKAPVACFTCGLGIRMDYVAEILKSFTTANTNL